MWVIYCFVLSYFAPPPTVGVVFGITFKMNLGIHTTKEKLNRGVLLNLKESMHLKTQAMLLSLYLKWLIVPTQHSRPLV